jgi:hypothetical protein
MQKADNLGIQPIIIILYHFLTQVLHAFKVFLCCSGILCTAIAYYAYHKRYADNPFVQLAYIGNSLP